MNDTRLARAGEGEAAKAEDPFASDGVARGGGLEVGERAPEPVSEADAWATPDTDPAEPSRRRRASSGSTTPKSKPRPMPQPSPSTAGSKTKGNGGVYPSPKPSKPSKKADSPGQPGQGLWPEVKEGDTLRRGGNCGLAKMRYAKARKADEAKVRARALAGEGLCEYAAGQTSKAKKLFAQARAAHPSVDSFIDAELGSMSAPRAQADEVAEELGDDDDAPIQTKE